MTWNFELSLLSWAPKNIGNSFLGMGILLAFKFNVSKVNLDCEEQLKDHDLCTWIDQGLISGS